MNALFRSLATGPTRRKLTGADAEAILAASGEDRIKGLELIDGDLIQMPAEGDLHVTLKVRLNRWLVRAAPDDVLVAPEAPLKLSESDWPEPEFFLYPASVAAADVRGPDALLVIEIGVSSLAYDLAEKAELYARHGVREYWVVDPAAARTHVHRGPEGARWTQVSAIPADQTINPQALEGLIFRLSDLL
jgi:Uma2 family endonuclease